MYKVYRDPEGKTVQLGITTTDQPQQQQQQQPRNTFQYSEDTYKLQIQKLNGEVAMLRKRVIVYILLSMLHVCSIRGFAYRIAGKFGGILIWRFANSQRLADFNLVKA